MSRSASGLFGARYILGPLSGAQATETKAGGGNALANGSEHRSWQFEAIAQVVGRQHSG